MQRCSNPGCQVPRGILFCSVAPNICGSSLPNVLHVTLSSSSSSFPPPVLRSMQVPGHLQDQFLGDSIPSCFSPVSKHPFSSYHIQQFQPSLSWPSNGPFSFWNIFKRFLHSSFFLTFFTHVLTIIFFLFFLVSEIMSVSLYTSINSCLVRIPHTSYSLIATKYFPSIFPTS